MDDTLEHFITHSRSRLNAILERLDWTEELVLKNYNGQSVASSSESEPELEDDELCLPASCAATNSVTLTREELQQVVNDPHAQIPQRFSDLQVNFTREQRLGLYEHIVERTGQCTEPESRMPLLHDGQLSFAEIVALKNREKKKKRKYRKSKPTHIEEVRGLVDLQMQALQQYLGVDDRREAVQRAQKSPKHQNNPGDCYRARRRDCYSGRSDATGSRQRAAESRRRSKSRSWSRQRMNYRSPNRRTPRRRSPAKRPRNEIEPKETWRSSYKDESVRHRGRSRSRSRSHSRSRSRSRRKHKKKKEYKEKKEHKKSKHKDRSPDHKQRHKKLKKAGRRHRSKSQGC